MSFNLQPQLRVNPTVIRVRDSVHLTCEPPQGLHEDQTQCSFITATVKTISRNSDCSVSITGAELVILGGHSVDSQIHIFCMYTLDSGYDSPFTGPVRVTVSGGPTAVPPSSHPPSPLPPPEKYVSSFLWRHILSALVIFIALIFIVDHLLFTRCPSGSSRRSREQQEDTGEFGQTVC
ncbi:hypothetical protein GN956_G26022 [Arapaima gigas]